MSRGHWGDEQLQMSCQACMRGYRPHRMQFGTLRLVVLLGGLHMC